MRVHECALRLLRLRLRRPSIVTCVLESGTKRVPTRVGKSGTKRVPRVGTKRVPTPRVLELRDK